ncbi:ATP-binding protein [Spongiactinospora sp. TRM90649]|uniref:ATP-binding protein n=1 Tax=Spongiactinospora sp. TRM90649 TaxID=3031114 RepID=UPI0023F6A850|nr:ATP-binding protein [Spongiactinospora sp. TRM90649]MDF5755863.1 ATP-binding protein [Spongiactinospora sp. TRM90649]
MNEDSRPHDGSPAGRSVGRIAFGLPGLPGARDFAESCALRHGMSDERVGDLLLAVNEVATNAVTHGADSATMRVWYTGDHLVIQIHDDGQWATDGQSPGESPPAPLATSGMGLWVARRLSSRIAFDAGRSGTTVTMSFKV